MEKKELFKFPHIFEVPNSNLDGSSAKFSVVSVGYLFSHSDIYEYRLLGGKLGFRLEIYNDFEYFLGQFHYIYDHEAFADLMRFYTGDLELEFNDDHELIGKIYKYKTE